MLNQNSSIQTGHAVNIISGTHKGKAGIVQSLTPQQVYVALPSGATIRIWKKSVQISSVSKSQAFPSPPVATLEIGNNVNIIEGSYKNKEGSIKSLTRHQVYIKLSSGKIVRINQGSVVLTNTTTTKADTRPQCQYKIGASVVIEHHKKIFTKEVLPEQGMLGEITKVTPCYVWVHLFGSNKTLQKRKHNVRLINEK